MRSGMTWTLITLSLRRCRSSLRTLPGRGRCWTRRASTEDVMLVDRARKAVRADLESAPELRRLGTGWLSGVGALVLALAGLFFVLCLRYPSFLTIPEARGLYGHPIFRLALHFALIGAFALAILTLVLRTKKTLGFTAITITLLATILGGSRVPVHGELTTGVFLGL